jgi:3-phosphoshikimate 1-carboxyvinyltransferase
MGQLRVPLARRPVDAVVRVPGSKSITNRALICAALADGESVVEHCAPGDDTAAMVDCLGAFGVALEVGGEEVHVTGNGGRLPPGPLTVSARLAGTTSRFVTALAALGEGPYVVDGEPPLRRRPMGPLHGALRQLGALIDTPEGDGTLPVSVSGPARGGAVTVTGDVSSQYITALMLIGPYLPGGLEITLSTPLVSRPYVELTAAVMTAFGADHVDVGDARITVGPARYRGVRYVVEPDASSASYPLAVAAVAGGTVEVPGLGAGSLQGDARFADLLAAMGCDVSWSDDSVVVSGPPDRLLAGLEVDMADISDLVPTLAAVAVTAQTATRISGVGFIRHKESDRLGDLADELRATGARITVEPDGLLVEPAGARLHGARLGTHHDHRLAMAFGVLGTVVDDVVVDDPGVVGKSWPGFWEMLHALVESEGSP